MEHKVVALLPMKAHSERVHGKNFRDFNGKPLFRWMLDKLLQLQQIDLVVINTDARGMLQKYGVTDSKRVLIRDRHPGICGDLVSMNSIIADDLKAITAETYLMTHTTNPLLSINTIERAINEFHHSQREGLADSLFSVNKVQTRFYRENGSAVNHDPDNLIRTQDLETWYEENSNIYIFTRNSFDLTQTRIGQKPLLFQESRLESIDIDELEDWEFALMASKYFQST